MTGTAGTFTVRVTDPAFPAVASVVNRFRRVGVAAIAGSTPRRLPPLVLGLSDRFQVVRIAAQNCQAGVQVVQHQTTGDRPPVVLIDDAVRELVAAIRLDFAVARAAYAPRPQPVRSVVPDSVHDALDSWASGVLSWHTRILYPAWALGARHALYTAVSEGKIPNPLSRKARRTE